MRKWDRQKLQSAGRKLAIAVLLVSAVLLWNETGYFSGMGRRLSPVTGPAAAVGTAPVNSGKPAGTVQPLAAVVCGADGGRFGAAYDQESVMSVFHRFSADVGEALGSAGEPEPITRDEFQDCLTQCGLTLRFYSAQPLELLSAWLGAEMNGAAGHLRAELLCLCAGDSGVTLCFRTPEGEHLRCTTAVSREALLNRTAECTPNGAYYAFENALLSGGDGCTVILDGALSAGQVQCGVPLPAGTESDDLLLTMGMNSYAARSYTEADGTVVYVDDDTTLRLSPTGSLFFHRGAGQSAAPAMSETAAVDAAWTLAERSIGRSCGDATLLLAELTPNTAQNGYTVALDYAVNGIPVRLAAGHAAEIVLRSGVVTEVKLEFRRYTLTGTQETLLPALQAYAVAAAEQTTAELVYADGGETMNCIWVRSDG